MTALLPLGDQAVLAYFADESAALRFAAAVRRDAPPWLVDVVQAYASVAVFFDPDQCDFRTRRRPPAPPRRPGRPHPRRRRWGGCTSSRAVTSAGRTWGAWRNRRASRPTR